MRPSEHMSELSDQSVPHPSEDDGLDIKTILAAHRKEQIDRLDRLEEAVHKLEARLDQIVEARPDQASAHCAQSAAAAVSSSEAASSSAAGARFISPVPPLGSASAVPAAKLARQLLSNAATELEKDGIDVRSCAKPCRS